MAFGIQADPGSMLPYHQLQDSDYWVDDPDSIYYNQLVNIQETGQAWTSAEHMAAVSPEYNYGLALDYNKDLCQGLGLQSSFTVKNQKRMLALRGASAYQKNR